MSGCFHVLDDEPSVAQIVARALTHLGMSGCSFTDPVRFMTRTAARPPDLIVLDLSLGGTNAVEIMRQLGTLEYHGKVLLMSGWVDAALREGECIGRSCGLAMLEPLPKPFRLADLQQRVARIVSTCADCQISAANCASGE